MQATRLLEVMRDHFPQAGAATGIAISQCSEVFAEHVPAYRSCQALLKHRIQHGNPKRKSLDGVCGGRRQCRHLGQLRWFRLPKPWSDKAAGTDTSNDQAIALQGFVCPDYRMSGDM